MRTLCPECSDSDPSAPSLPSDLLLREQPEDEEEDEEKGNDEEDDGDGDEGYSSEAEVREQIRQTLIHELGHYFGMTEEHLKDVDFGNLQPRLHCKYWSLTP